MTPNFLHAGAAKAASTWLWRMCLEHPEIYVPRTPDNVNFFTVHYHRGLDWYRATYFADYHGEPAAGEFSNSYMVHEPALQRIARDLPEVRLTLTLRNPVERAYLQWAHIHLKKGKYGLDPDQNIALPLSMVTHHHGHSWFRLWIEPGLYAFLLKRLYRYIPAERVHVMLYDDLRADAAGFFSRFAAFLGVDASFTPDHLEDDINAPPPGSAMHRYISDDLRAELHRVYDPETRELEDMLGRDLTAWRAP